MRSDKAAQALHDIRDNIRLARDFAGALSLDDFKADRLRFYAVTRALEIISEAARRRGGFRRYRHDYDNVASDFVWRTVRHSLPPLLAAVLAEIERLEP